MRLKEALNMAPMDQCILPHRAPAREWWRYGWAWGFMERSLNDAQAPVTQKRYRDAIAIGYSVGKRHHEELEAASGGA